MTSCSLCRQERKLIKAHIIPRALYRPLFEMGSEVKVYSTEDGAFSKKSPQGIYDPGILCKSCDTRIGDWDNEAQRFLLSQLAEYGDPKTIVERGWFETHDFDYDRLKLFFISLVWRASVSSRPFFAQVDLGGWEKRARAQLLAGHPGDSTEFETVLARFEHPLANVIRNPVPITHLGVDFYRFRLAGYIALIKVSDQEIHAQLRPFTLRRGQPVVIRIQDFESSAEFSANLQDFGNMKEN